MLVNTFPLKHHIQAIGVRRYVIGYIHFHLTNCLLLEVLLMLTV